ncbi:MAG: DUF983 domain-containing protein [Acidimicrobiia bacterium]|nr:DUF983 domain-containing protein [Acidimicrobiia bacterium]
MGLPAGVLLRRGCARRCPMCGHGHLFTHWFSMVPTCPGCGLRFRREPGMWLGSWFLNVCLAQVVVVVLLLVGVALTWPQAPGWPMFVAAVGAAVAFPVAFFPTSRTVWVAVDLIMRPAGFDDGVAPAVELEQLERYGRSKRSGGPPPG